MFHSKTVLPRPRHSTPKAPVLASMSSAYAAISTTSMSLPAAWTRLVRRPTNKVGGLRASHAPITDRSRCRSRLVQCKSLLSRQCHDSKFPRMRYHLNIWQRNCSVNKSGLYIGRVFRRSVGTDVTNIYCQSSHNPQYRFRCDIQWPLFVNRYMHKRAICLCNVGWRHHTEIPSVRLL